MRILLQRVKQADVQVEGVSIGKIGKGLLVFLGIHKEDTILLLDSLISKMTHLRIFSDKEGKMNRSLLDVQGDILVVSQFTLYGDCNQGRRPAFSLAADPVFAKNLYEEFILRLKAYPLKVESGLFGAHMEVSLVNEGPVTFLLEK